MASAQTRKRKSEHMATPEAVTPTGSPAPKRMRITESQKQALIDNLQLEVTERARRLRAQYAIQCKDLRARIERRIHRIPIPMRNITMAELIARKEETSKPAPAPALIVKVQEQTLPSIPQTTLPSVSSPSRLQQKQVLINKPRKRKSSEIHIASDKENDHGYMSNVSEALPVAKNVKRAKATAAVPRAASRTQKTRSSKDASGVLSPRSHNSRTLPRSPIKDAQYPTSPTKMLYNSHIARPISPLKPNSPLKSAATAATSAISASVHGMIESARNRTLQASKSTRGTNNRTASKETITGPTTSTRTGRTAAPRTVSAQSNHSNSTEASTVSNATVVTKPKRQPTKKTTAMAPPAKPAKSTTTAASKMSALKKSASVSVSKSTPAEPTTGRRILRKRN